MSELSEAIEATREALVNLDEQVGDEVAVTYTNVQRRLEKRLFEIIDSDDQNAQWRLRSLIDQAEQEFDRYASQTLRSTITRHSTTAALQANQSGVRLIQAQLWPDANLVIGAFDRLPTQAIETMVGMTRSGPYQRLLNSFGPDIAANMRTELEVGLGAGNNPRVVARKLLKIMGDNANRADNIARTSMITAHRHSHQRVYQQNSHIVKEWVWNSALDERTCFCCIGMHGSAHPLAEGMASHPRCRCAMIPKTRTWAELGYQGIPETAFESETGGSWLARQPLDKQRTILGPERFKLYQQGVIDITDMVGIKHNNVWGDSVYKRPLNQLVLGGP